MRAVVNPTFGRGTVVGWWRPVVVGLWLGGWTGARDGEVEVGSD